MARLHAPENSPTTADHQAAPSTSGRDATNITLLHRSVAAGGASLVSAVIVNPLDVVKTRLQAQDVLWTSALRQPQMEVLEKWSFAGCGSSCLRLQSPGRAPACGPACTAVYYSGTLDALRKIVRGEGAAVLWRGTDVALLMAIPMVGIYLPLYDEILSRLQAAGAGLYAPLLAGSLARTAAVVCTAPFELLRTRLQAATHPAAQRLPAGAPRQRLPQLLLHHAPAGGSSAARVARLWTGVGATLARDVPFSAIYWGLVEPVRGALMPVRRPPTETEVVLSNVAAGGVSGAVAGAVTTPLDVVKTRVQLAAGPLASGNPVLGTLRRIWRTEGAAALFQGGGARAAKAAPACAIVLSAYEALKHLYEGG